jgi:ABC-type multidrug transport system ATPase subunit
MVVYDIRGLTFQYPGRPRPANQDLNLQIHTGEVFGLLGDNGAGKTTLVRQMVNLLAPTAGTITLFDQPIASRALHVPLHVGYMPQESHALNNLTVGEALYFTAHLRGLGRADARAHAREQLTLWQIESLRDQPSTRLSGGQRRLLRLAVAAAGHPPVLVLDEPTNDLDPQRRRLVWEVLRRLNAEHGTTIIFITHDAIEAEKVVQRVGILRQGEMAALGRPSDLKRAIDDQLRLELFFSPAAPPRLPPDLTVHTLQPGRWLALLRRDQATAVLESLDLNQVDDFRLYSATLEDLYLHYADHAA